MLYHLGTENKKVLLFIDIIGFSNLVKRNDKFDVNDGNPHEITLMFQDFYTSLASKYSAKYQEIHRIKFLWASDTIVISTDIENADELINDIIYLQNQFYTGGMAFRGCICIGNLYHQENIWGEPLVRAAEIEKEKVNYPRVIISKDDFNKLSLSEDHKRYFEQDELNTEFVSFMPFLPNIDSALAKEANIVRSILHVYSNMIIENCNSAPNEVRVKWKWMAKKLIETLNTKEDQIKERLTAKQQCGISNCDLDAVYADMNALLHA